MDVGSRKRGLRGAEVLGLSSSKDGVAVAGFGKAERGRTGQHKELSDGHVMPEMLVRLQWRFQVCCWI